MNPEFKNTYHQKTGPKYQKDKMLSKAWIVENILPSSSLEHIYRKMNDFSAVIVKDFWKSFEGCKNVLELGCGNGAFLFLAPEGVNAQGIEIIDQEVKNCREKGLNVIKADAEKKLPFKDDSFDGVYMCHVIEHFEKPHLVIEEIRRILKKDGKLVILTPNFATTYKKFYNDYTHKKPFTKRGLFKLLSDLEFKNIQIKNEPYNTSGFFFTFLNYFPILWFRNYGNCRK